MNDHPLPVALILLYQRRVAQMGFLGLPPVDGAEIHMAACQHRQPLTGAARGVTHQCLGAELLGQTAAGVVQQYVVRARQQQPVVHHPLVATA